MATAKQKIDIKTWVAIAALTLAVLGSIWRTYFMARADIDATKAAVNVSKMATEAVGIEVSDVQKSITEMRKDNGERDKCIAIVQTEVGAIKQSLIEIRQNHLTHIEERLDAIERKFDL